MGVATLERRPRRRGIGGLSGRQYWILGVGPALKGPFPVLEYLNQHLPATPEVLAMAAPLKPIENTGKPASTRARRFASSGGQPLRLFRSSGWTPQWTYATRSGLTSRAKSRTRGELRLLLIGK